MRYTGEPAVKRAIAMRSVSGAVLVFGDDFLSAVYAERLAKSVCNVDAAFDYYVFEADTFSFDALYDAAEGLPVLSEKVCILVRDLPLDKLKKDETSRLMTYLAQLPSTTLVIFLMSAVQVDEKAAAWKNWIASFEKNGNVLALSGFDRRGLGNVLASGAKRRGMRVSAAVLDHLIETAGTDLQTLQKEMDKLAAFAGDSEVTEEMVDALCVHTIEASVFDLTTAVFSGRNDRAFEILAGLSNDKTDPILICGTIISELVALWRVQVTREARHSLRETADRFYDGRTFSLEKAERNAGRIGKQALDRMLDAARRADEQLKGFSSDGFQVLRELLCRLALAVQTA